MLDAPEEIMLDIKIIQLQEHQNQEKNLNKECLQHLRWQHQHHLEKNLLDHHLGYRQTHSLWKRWLLYLYQLKVQKNLQD